MGGKFCCLTPVTPVQATPEPPPVQRGIKGQLRRGGSLVKAPGLGWIHNPSLACGEGWVRPTLRLFLNLVGNKSTGLGIL